MHDGLNGHPRWRGFSLAVAGLAGAVVGVSGTMALAPPPHFEHEIVASAVKPHPKLTPEAVVRLQMASLQASAHDSAAISDCFALASPANRLVTGPIDRFAAMVVRPAYRPLLEPSHYLIGTAHRHDRRAVVLVTLVNTKGRIRGYRFLLSLQNDPSVAGCWMTDAVVSAVNRPGGPGG